MNVSENGIMYLRAEHLTKAYGGHTLFRDLSFDLQTGGRILITGDSGSGKTTLIRLLLRLEKPDSGGVITDLPRSKRGVLRAGCVFQEDRLTASLSAVENIASADGMDRSQFSFIREELEKILPDDCADKPVNELSGGMRRRVCIVRALMAESGILIFDEPFSGLDEANRSRCLSQILAQQGDRLLVITAHGKAEAYDSFREVPLASCL